MKLSCTRLVIKSSLRWSAYFSLPFISAASAQTEPTANNNDRESLQDLATDNSEDTILGEFTPPNVILIMTDDMGWGDFSIHGNKVYTTPNLDAMAERSASWENFYVSPVCSPTRASLMTGRYNQRTKCLDTYLGRSMMATDEVTIAEALKGAGFATGIFGKWHLGDNYPMRPSDQGFEYSLVHRGGGLGQPSEPLANNSRYTDPILFRNDSEVQMKGYCTDIYFDEAIKFIKKSNASERPFFAYIATNTPHGPFNDVPSDKEEIYKAKDLSGLNALTGGNSDSANNKKLVKIGAMISNIDDNVGKLFKTLEDEKLMENTIVIYLNDNGPNTKRYTGKFRGMKSDIFEGGVRSPLWIHWPNKLKSGTKISSNSAAHIDIMPTIMDACSLGTPEAFAFDGRSLFTKLQNPESELETRPIVIQAHRGATLQKYHHFMIRDGKWKLVNNSGFSKTRLPEGSNFELYDLSTDPSESKNVAKENPTEVKRLVAAYDDWFKDVTSTRIRDKGTAYIHIDQKHENPVVLTWQDRIAKNWTIEDSGFWKLSFQHQANIDVRVSAVPAKYNKDITGYTPVLQVGDKEYTSEPVTKQGVSVFEAVSVPKGRTTIQAKFVSPDGTEEVPAYQLRLIHR